MNIAWFLVFFMTDPCCDVGVIRLNSEAECHALMQGVVASNPLKRGPSPKGFHIECVEVKS